jgi:hypothetical protein
VGDNGHINIESPIDYREFHKNDEKHDESFTPQGAPKPIAKDLHITDDIVKHRH